MKIPRAIRKVRNITNGIVRKMSNPGSEARIRELINLIIHDQFNDQLHFDLGKAYIREGNLISGIAELRTAMSLSKDPDAYKVELYMAYKKLGLVSYANKVQLKNTDTTVDTFDLTELTHNTYFRLKTFSNLLEARYGDRRIRVLDVGGGNGMMNLFIPDVDYVLAEPTVNGIGGETLMFEDNHFDVVLSSHVLEHVPANDREAFLDSLCRCSRDRVLLLNPFDIPGTYTYETLDFLNDITGASWIQEHIDCIMPKTDELEEYAKRRNIRINLIPNGSVTTSVAMVLADYFARKADKQVELKKVNQFFNREYFHILDHDTYPNAYLIEFTLND